MAQRSANTQLYALLFGLGAAAFVLVTINTAKLATSQASIFDFFLSWFSSEPQQEQVLEDNNEVPVAPMEFATGSNCDDGDQDCNDCLGGGGIWQGNYCDYPPCEKDCDEQPCDSYGDCRDGASSCVFDEEGNGSCQDPNCGEDCDDCHQTGGTWQGNYCDYPPCEEDCDDQPCDSYGDCRDGSWCTFDENGNGTCQPPSSSSSSSSSDQSSSCASDDHDCSSSSEGSSSSTGSSPSSGASSSNWPSDRH